MCGHTTQSPHGLPHHRSARSPSASSTASAFDNKNSLRWFDLEARTYAHRSNARAACRNAPAVRPYLDQNGSGLNDWSDLTTDESVCGWRSLLFQCDARLVRMDLHLSWHHLGHAPIAGQPKTARVCG